MGSGRGRVVKSVKILLHYFVTIQVIEGWRIVYGSHAVTLALCDVRLSYTAVMLALDISRRSSLKVEVIECWVNRLRKGEEGV